MIRRTFCKCLPGAALCAKAVAVSWAAAGVKEVGMDKKVTAVKAKVLSVKGTCSLGHKVGDVVTFTETGVQGKICIHALYSMLPAVFAMLFDVKFPWLANSDVKTHPCTDAANPVVFELAKVRES
jgi:uncharacterized repeat protein (TIGR04076 family)